MTVTSAAALKPPSTVSTVIVVFPAFTAVTVPYTTVATEVSLEVHFTALFAASSGDSVAVSFPVSPAVNVSSVLSSVTPVTFLGAAVNFTNFDSVGCKDNASVPEIVEPSPVHRSCIVYDSAPSSPARLRFTVLSAEALAL
ncbi:hypothetical protein D3C76_97610 [compost metagenome]